MLSSTDNSIRAVWLLYLVNILGPSSSWLMHASLPYVYNISVTMLLCQSSAKTHHTVAFGLQQSSNERIRVGNLARDWNIITATPNSFNTASLDLCQPVCNGFEADTTNPFSLQVKGDRRSTDVISYLSNDSLACNIDIVGWVDQLVDTLSNTTGACAISLHQAYIGTDHGELRQDLVVFVAQKHNDQLTGVNEFLQEQGFPVAPFCGYLIAQISPESFESLRLLANERGIAFPSSFQDGVHRLVFAGNFVQLNHPGVTVDATLQFSHQAPTPSYLYTTITTLEWLSNYASGRRYRVVTVQDASSQHHYTALWFDVSRAQAVILEKGRTSKARLKLQLSTGNDLDQPMVLSPALVRQSSLFLIQPTPISSSHSA